MLPALLTVLGQVQPVFEFDYRGGRGLEVRVSGVPVIRGSSVQYYEPGWTKGYYSSNWQAVEVRKVDTDTVAVGFHGADGQAKGEETLHREGDRLKVHYHFEWSGPHPVQIEVSPGLIEAPVFEAGKMTADGQPTRSLAATADPKTDEFDARRYSADARSYAIESPLTNVEITSSIPLTLFDGRGYAQDWADGKSVWWHGALALDVANGKPVDFDLEYRFKPRPVTPDRTQTVSAQAVPITRAGIPDESIFPMIPKPQKAAFDYSKPLEVTGVFAFPAGQVRFWQEFKDALARRYVIPAPAKGAHPVNIDGGVSRMRLHPGAYTIDITAKGISVLGEEDEGLHYGMLRLARLVYAKGGKLWLPTGTMRDEPQTLFRGAHFFGGPEARLFQRKLWERVLLPLGMNKAVIQCERAEWKSTPLDPSEHPMKREELVGLFDDYRKMGVEPIPLIQSFGHMEWFFAGGKRLDLALNHAEPYAIDPEKPESRKALETLWDEAVDLLKPKQIHFGCDEVDMIGFTPNDPKRMTSLWTKQMAVLGGIAKAHDVKMMLWGDMALAPGEAPDATNGATKDEATARRAAIPEGAMICDWHYKPDPRPESFYPTLQLWKREEHTPIASAWYRPDNVRGFDLAATMEKVGTLQTTWAGYESSERGMIEALDQFTPMVLAADYAWSGRPEKVADLGYDPAAVFRKMYFDEPSPLRPVGGTSAKWGEGAAKPLEIGNAGFVSSAPISMRGILSAETMDAPTTIEVPFAAKGTRILLAMDTVHALSQGDPVADVEVQLADGKSVKRRLAYGHHIRANSDPAMVPYADRSADKSRGICAITVVLGDKPVAIKRVVIHQIGQSAGTRLYGITAR